MELKKFQKKVINDLESYCQLLNETGSVVSAYNKLWLNQGVNVGFNGLATYNNTISNTPHVCFKVPTGGGKTFLACNALRVIFNNLPSEKLKVVVWLVPSEAILTQTLNNLTNPSHPYRQKIETDFNGRVQIYTKQQALDGQQFNITQINEQLSIIVMSFDSLRIRNKEARKIYQENGNLNTFANYSPTPATKIENVDDTALIQVLNQLSPVVIVDESHHTTGDLSVEMLKNLNPSFILDLTATPRKNSNIISYVDASQLKAENMVKLPVILYNRPSQEQVIIDAIDLREKLETMALENEKNNGVYIRPIVLFQAQPKIDENKETFEKLKERLVGLGIPKEEIAIKTAEINEIKNVNLLSHDCKIKYIITVNALKEGWDCPFAYILATLANKTSVVDVEQILGRVLRLPYTKQHDSKFLNLSYVLTSSNDFNSTIKKVITGLNNAGFSEKEYRIAETQEVEPVKVHMLQSKMENLDKQEEFLQFNDEVVKEELINRKGQASNTITSMLASAEEKSDSYDEILKESSSEVFGNLPLEVRSKMSNYVMYENFKDEVKILKIPQFFVKPKPNIFTQLDSDYKVLLTNEMLLDNFTLRDKDIEIDFTTATESFYEIDVNKNESPKYRRLEGVENKFYKEIFDSLPPESKKRNCKYQIKTQLEKLDNVSGSDLADYIDRVVDNMNSEAIAELEKNIYGYTSKIEAKIKLLQMDHQRKKFREWLEQGKIYCLPSFSFSSVISPTNAFKILQKSLYTAEQSVNGFELDVIEKVASLSNIKWWHRNIDRQEFYINGFLNHYPDFIAMTNSGKIVMIETKGDYLASNDNSREKAELGKIWQSQAGADYRYYMVSKEDIQSNPDSITLDEFLTILKEL